MLLTKGIFLLPNYKCCEVYWTARFSVTQRLRPEKTRVLNAKSNKKGHPAMNAVMPLFVTLHNLRISLQREYLR